MSIDPLLAIEKRRRIFSFGETPVIPTFSAANQVAPEGPAGGGSVVSVPKEKVGSVAAYFLIRIQSSQTVCEVSERLVAEKPQ